LKRLFISTYNQSSEKLKNKLQEDIFFFKLFYKRH